MAVTYLQYLAAVEGILEAEGYPWRRDQVEGYVNWLWWNVKVSPEKAAEMFKSYVIDRQDRLDLGMVN